MKRCALTLCLLIAVTVMAERPAAWAKKLEMPGLPNLHQVSTELYRSACPLEDGGVRDEKRLGIRTVICLRVCDKSEKVPEGVKIHHIRMNPFGISDADIREVLQLLQHKEDAPFLIHCTHGADRTGVMCAAYRICVQGWTKEEAIAEMKNGGFGYHRILTNLEKTVRKMNVEQIRKVLAENTKAAVH